MILRRLTKHVQDQNWFAVGLDFFIVVVGILLAFQITNWNESRAERALELNYLSAMERDVEYSIRVLERSISQLEGQQDARRGLYEFRADQTAVLESSELDRLVARGIFALERADINQTTFETLKSTGQLSLIKSPALVEVLQDISALVAMSEVDKAEDFQFTFRNSDPLLIGEGDFDNILIHDLGAMHDRVSWIKEQPTAGYSAKFVKSKRLKNIILFRTLFGQLRLEGYQRILDRHQSLLTLINERQEKLGATQ